MSMLLTYPPGYSPINEKLTKTDKAEIKRMVSDQIEDILEDELSKVLKTRATRTQIGDITKKVIKKLYRDLSHHHPYIIDRIKV